MRLPEELRSFGNRASLLLLAYHRPQYPSDVEQDRLRNDARLSVQTLLRQSKELLLENVVLQHF